MGTIEHVHDATKNELGARVPPCGRFGANAAWHRLSMLTYNVLSAMKSLALPGAPGSARPKRLRFLLFNIAGRILSTGGRPILRIAQELEERVQRIAACRRLRAVLLASLLADPAQSCLKPRVEITDRGEALAHDDHPHGAESTCIGKCPADADPGASGLSTDTSEVRSARRAA